MRTLSTFVFGIIVGGALVFFGQRYHLLRTDRGFETVPKLSSGFNDTYVDVRMFQSADWERHKELAAAIVHAKREDLLGTTPSDQTRQGVGRFVDQLKSIRGT
ncbi:MAG TPA: hypothetical protein VGN12_29680 [Pirellulales bacterium]|jgi:hypothetical protein